MLGLRITERIQTKKWRLSVDLNPAGSGDFNRDFGVPQLAPYRIS